MSLIEYNRNRIHAVEQLKKALKNKNNLDEGIEELRTFAAIANALIYVGDNLKELINNMKYNNYYKDYIHDEEETS